TFTKTVLAGIGAAALPALPEAQAQKRLKIGITMLIFGAVPRTPENLEPALKDCSELGYYSFETFASILEDLDKKGTLAAMLEKYPIPLRSAFVTVNLTDPSQRKSQIEMLQRYATVLKKHGGSYLVQSPNGPRTGYVFAEHKANIISALNEYGKVVTDMGLRTGLHQHTGTVVETREETYDVLNAIDTRYMHFAPDIGQAQKGGTDAAQMVKDFAKIIDHMHLKDFKGWEHMGGYCPLGEGKVDLKSVLETMEKANPNANIMHELDGSQNMPYTPRQTAEISKKYLQSLGYSLRT
ncbi:MAG TPA: sugar phosphate isomerase/epimerase, partial [Vicinamibacterales bacterium]|nr:sugar phosphate isomerase/epimerase [Vicinamibacterales bacterium]